MRVLRKPFISVTIECSMEAPLLVVSDDQGNMFEIPHLHMAGMALGEMRVPAQEELIPLPHGSNLFMLPGRAAVGFNTSLGRFTIIEQYRGVKVTAAAAFMAPAYLQFLRPAYCARPGAARLPLYAYTAVGWYKGEFYAAGTRIDHDSRQDLRNFRQDRINKAAERMLRRYPGNRLAAHLVENCVHCYDCPAARNFVLERWECPVPTSPACNAGCAGCISLQPETTGVVSSQERISFTPTVREIVEFTVPHLEKAARPVISFGQGCEGEPLLQSDLIAESIREIRRHTDRGIINLNTNGSLPRALESLFKAGLDSIRVSLNSAQEKYYTAYYRPRGYAFADAVESLAVAREYRRWSSVNYLAFPGFTDHKQEITALDTLIRSVKPNMLQTRNLNMDPDWYMQELELDALEPSFIGMREWISHIHTSFPWVKLGYFNPPQEEMKEAHFAFGV